MNLNVHLHMIVFTFDGDATRFHSVKAPTSADMQTLLDRIIRRTGVLIQDTEQPYLELTQADLQDTFNFAIGPNSGNKTLTLRSEALSRTDTQAKPFTVNRDGFSLGHKKLTTTARYTHVANRTLSEVVSPLKAIKHIPTA